MSKLWRWGGEKKESLQLVSSLWNLNSTSNFPVASRRLSYQISANWRESETSANVKKHWKTRAKGNDVIFANHHFAGDPRNRSYVHYRFSFTLTTYLPHSLLTVFYLLTIVFCWKKFSLLVIALLNLIMTWNQYLIGLNGGWWLWMNLRLNQLFFKAKTDKPFHPQNPQLILNNSIIEDVTVHKHLGLTLSSNLSWQAHILKNSSKSFRNIKLPKAH